MITFFEKENPLNILAGKKKSDFQAFFGSWETET